VNELLQPEQPVPFDFLINGAPLRSSSIWQYLDANSRSGEETLEVEYVRALQPPSYVASFEHEAWLSSVDVLSRSSPASSCAGSASQIGAGQERILSAGYDGVIRMWNMSSSVVAMSPHPIHTGSRSGMNPILACKMLSPAQIVSGHMDATIQVWEYREAANGLSGSISSQLELRGHMKSVNSIAVQGASRRILSGSSDNTVCLWSADPTGTPLVDGDTPASQSAQTAKKRKLNASTAGTPQQGPLAVLKHHEQMVTSVVFDDRDATVGYSASWDHDLCTWDLTTAKLVDTRTIDSSLSSLANIPELHLLAVGNAPRHITLIDPRQSTATIAAMKLRGHTNSVTCFAVDPSNPSGLVSGSKDGTCRVWDLRSARPESEEGVVGNFLYRIPRRCDQECKRRSAGEGVSVYGVCWDRDLGIVSAGEDKTVQINRGEGLLPPR